MPRKYRISPFMKRVQVKKAIRTRYRRYGKKYFSLKGVKKVSNNLVKARRKLNRSWAEMKNV